MAERAFMRQKASRLFAAEIRGTNFEIPKQGQGEYESQLYLSPTGSKVSRVFLVGTATEIEDIGTDSSFFRMRVADPTGVAFVSAGKYQPDATRVIQELAGKLPAFVAVVGKLSVYTPEEGSPLSSIRAEDISIVDEATRNTWLVETAKATLGRIKALKDDSALSDSVAKAYSGARDDHKEIVRKVLLEIRAASAPAKPESQSKPSGKEAGKPESACKEPVVETGKLVTIDNMKNFVLQKIVSLNKDNKGVKIESLINPCNAGGMSSAHIETSIAELMREGRIYEPKLGVVVPTGGE